MALPVKAVTVQQIAGLLLLCAAIFQIVARGMDASTLALLTPALALLGFDLSGIGKGGKSE